MQWVAIVALSILCCVTYGIIHDQFTVRICAEYFTIGHPRIIFTEDPTLLAFFWGVAATWWLGTILGVALATIARIGSLPKKSACSLLPPMMILLAFCAILATIAGFTQSLVPYATPTGGQASRRNVSHGESSDAHIMARLICRDHLRSDRIDTGYFTDELHHKLTFMTGKLKRSSPSGSDLLTNMNPYTPVSETNLGHTKITKSKSHCAGAYLSLLFVLGAFIGFLYGKEHSLLIWTTFRNSVAVGEALAVVMFASATAFCGMWLLQFPTIASVKIIAQLFGGCLSGYASVRSQWLVEISGLPTWIANAIFDNFMLFTLIFAGGTGLATVWTINVFFSRSAITECVTQA